MFCILRRHRRQTHVMRISKITAIPDNWLRLLPFRGLTLVTFLESNVQRKATKLAGMLCSINPFVLRSNHSICIMHINVWLYRSICTTHTITSCKPHSPSSVSLGIFQLVAISISFGLSQLLNIRPCLSLERRPFVKQE